MRPSLPALAVILLLPAALPAQTFEDTADVLTVEVPVNVVRRDGTPVRGLTLDDFEILEEGRAQTIAGIEVVDLAALRGEDLAGRPLPSAGRRHFLLLFDLSFANPTAVLRARAAAREIVLQALHPTDLVAVATYSIEEGPRLVVTFTPDRAQVARAIDTLGVRRRDDLTALNLDPLHFLVATPEHLPDSRGSSGEETRIDLRVSADALLREHLQILQNQLDRSQRAFERSRVVSYTRDLGTLARLLGSVRGRKHVLLFSEGFDSRLALGRQPLGDDEEQQRDRLNMAAGRAWMVDTEQIYGSSGLLGELDKMVEQFRRADCLVQAVDIGGLRASGDTRALAQQNIGQDSLFFIAHETGGELFKDGNNIQHQLVDALQRSAVTYVLTYQPTEVEFDGSYRDLKVRLRGESRGLQVSHRTGYYRPRPFAVLDPLEKTLLASDAVASAVPMRDFPMSVLVAPFRAGDAAYVPVIVELAGSGLLDAHSGERLAVEIYVYVTDHRGEVRDFLSQNLQLDLRRSRQQLLDGGLKYYGHLQLAPGRYRVRVLVRNATTGRAAVESLPLDIPAFQQLPMVLLPPFFVEPPGRWILVREQTAGGTGDSVVYPFTVNGEPYIPAARPRVRGQGDARVCLVGYNLPQGELALAAEVLDASGAPVAGGVLHLVERTVTGISGLDKLLARFTADGLGPGDYVLRVSVSQASGGALGVNAIPFSVLN